MMVRKFTILIFLFLLTPFHVHAEVRGRALDYRSGTTTLKGYLAYDDAISGKAPGILVVHEWWGHNEYARKRARMLARLGYVALAVDMYGDGKVAEHPDDAGKFSGEIRKNMNRGRMRFLAAMRVLKDNPHVDPDRIGAIGYCFGGGVVLQMARDGVNLRGVASFHGGLSTPEPAKAGNVRAEILVLNGGSDPLVKPSQIIDFEKEMKDAGADYHLISYAGAKHSFTNPDATRIGKKFNLPLEYNEEADRLSWEEMKTFFRKLFGR